MPHGPFVLPKTVYKIENFYRIKKCKENRRFII